MPVFFLFLFCQEPCPIHLVLNNGQTLCLQEPFSVEDQHILFNDPQGRLLQVTRTRVNLQRSGATDPRTTAQQPPSPTRRRSFPWHLPAYQHLDRDHISPTTLVVDTEAVQRFGRSRPLPKPRNRSQSRPIKPDAKVTALTARPKSSWGRQRKRVVRSANPDKAQSGSKKSTDKRRARSRSTRKGRSSGTRGDRKSYEQPSRFSDKRW